MVRQVRRLARGENSEVLAYTGPAGEPIFNVDTKTLHMQDGATAGGVPLLRRDLLSAAGGCGLVGFSHASAYSAGTAGNKLRKWVSITDAPYNADPTGVADASAAFQAAYDAGVKYLHVPAGDYKLSAGLTVSRPMYLRGDGRGLSRLLFTGSIDVLTFTGFSGGCGVSDLTMVFSGGGRAAGGAAIKLDGASNSIIERVEIVYAYDAILVKNQQNTNISNCIIWEMAHYGVGLIGNLVTTYISRCFINGGSGNPSPNDVGANSIGIYLLDKCDGTYASQCDVVLCRFALLADASAGSTHLPGYSNFDSVYFDSSTDTAWISKGRSFRFNGCWFSSRSENGVTLVDSDDTGFTNCAFVWTWKHNVLIQAAAKRTRFNGCSFSGAGRAGPSAYAAIAVADGMTGGLTVAGCVAGNNPVLPAGYNDGNMAFAVILGTGANNYILTNNDFRNVSNTALLNHSDASSRIAAANLV